MEVATKRNVNVSQVQYQETQTSAALLQKYLQIAQANHTTCSHLPLPIAYFSGL